ncbi:MAG: hypothetical protein B7Z44_03085 [Caulobacter sp. 12-67-6]|nr:MAG: hypothetical protein B7Z44_03085 [Caulobacter sp. 12-67-6]OYX71681.1 MAG: hypothetical protein B7Y81_08295 [Caulobacter sp. 32-67-35]OZA77826.1 MAG: hypothetical protein B7X77_04175 [Caulobacter sp. 39-67-4]HQR87828.1 hypothetical protein [Caulobacter sp.]
MAFDRSVFINCPFDDAYQPLLRAILFCIYYLGLEPRIAVERLDGAEPRIEKIIELIEASKFGIHDLSRIRAERAGELFRLNMPLELGLDIGCKRFKGRQWSEKRCLILETERYRYQAAISDLSNSDIEAHGDDPAEALTIVRNWLNTACELDAEGPSFIWGRFIDFISETDDVLVARGYSRRDIDRLPMVEWMRRMAAWDGMGK